MHVKIFVAIPVYDGKLPVQTAKSLIEESQIAAGLGVEFSVHFLTSCSVPAQGRNQLVQEFMESDCDRLFFLDSDVSFSPGSIVKICHMPVDFVGGCYRHKHRDESYPLTWKAGEFLEADRYGLLEVAMLPTGFLALSKNVFETLKAAYPGREYAHWNHKAYAYFQTVFKDGLLYGEDAYFCKEWVDAGGKIHLYPELDLSHWDFNPTPFKGHIGNWLKSRPSFLNDCIRRLGDGQERGTEPASGAVKGQVAAEAVAAT